MSARLVHFLRLGLAGIAVMLSLAAVPGLFAQEVTSEVRSSAEYVYGQSMRFNLTAQNVGEIEDVTLYFRLGTSSDSFAVQVPMLSGPPIEASYALDLTQTRLPPFGAITYWWVLQRPDGSQMRVPEQVVSYVDDQFNWRQLSETDEQGGGSIRIHWTGDDENLGETARTITLEILPVASRLLPLDRILPFDIYIYPSSADLSAALRLAGRDYVPGQTYPDLGVVLAIVVNPQTAETELRQELARGLVDLLIFQAVGQFAFRLPPWVGRGIAGVVRGEPDAILENELASALAEGTIRPVEELCSQARVDTIADQAQSESLIAYITANHGEQAVADLIMAFADGADCSTAIGTALGTTPEQLEIAWQQSMRQPDTAPTLGSIAIWTLLILAGFAFATLLIIRPRRR